MDWFSDAGSIPAASTKWNAYSKLDSLNRTVQPAAGIFYFAKYSSSA